jgi:hypothetical protein
MILTDFLQIAISNLHQQLKQSKNDPTRSVKRKWLSLQDKEVNEEELNEQVNPAMLRHMVLESIRRLNREFSGQYGKIVICTDNQNYWRKTEFKYYKANRKRDRDNSKINWDLVFQTLNNLRDEIRENFPYKVMDVPGAEADDIIGVIAKHFHTKDKILILSGDHDFSQLQIYPNVDQYNPIRDEFIKIVDPIRFLKEHIINGDRGDGIPNFLSNDDCFVTKTRQVSVYQKKVDVWVTQEPEQFCDERMLKNYYRNKKLVDLTQIPEAIETAILNEFEQPIIGSRDKIYGYLVKNRLKNLLEHVRDF